MSPSELGKCKTLVMKTVIFLCFIQITNCYEEEIQIPPISTNTNIKLKLESVANDICSDLFLEDVSFFLISHFTFKNNLE